jgi:subtilase family serine protease
MGGVKIMSIKTVFSLGIIFLFSSVFAMAALDLSFVGTITQTPDPATQGNTITFSVSFRTNGGAVTNMKITGGIYGTQLFERTYGSIGADMTRTDSFTWTGVTGDQLVWFELDPGHTCGDSDYTNNKIQKHFFVASTSGKYPDLSVNAVYDAVKIKEDDKITFHIYVSNTGETWSDPCKLWLVHTGANVAYAAFDVPQVPNGSIWNTNYEWTVDCGAPLMLYVDALQKIAETNEDNNTWKKTMNCGFTFPGHPDLSEPLNKQDPNGPDLIVKILKIYKDPSDSTGNTAIVEYEVQNIGKAASVSCVMNVKRGGVHDQNVVIPAIGVGQKHSGSFKEGFVCGQQTIVKVDSNYKNVEINETNNTAKKTILCINLSKDAMKNIK